MFKSRTTFLAVLALLVALIVGGCVQPTPPAAAPLGGDQPVSSGAQEPGAASETQIDPAVSILSGGEPTLEDTLWQLFAYVDPGGQLLLTLPGSGITAQFTAGEISGSAGCNNYFGTYTAEGDSLEIQVGGTTRMACPEALMAQEIAYLAALGSAASHTIQDGQLFIADDLGQPALVYRQVQSTPLVDTTWLATGYNNGQGGFTSLLAGSEITALFDDEGQVSGSAGCNSYFASYQVEGNRIEIGPVAATEMYCQAPEGLMEQESAYLSALAQAATVTVEGDRLELTALDGSTVAQYVAAGGSQASPELGLALANLAYQSEWTQSGTAPLTDGIYREPAAPDSETELVVQLMDFVALGDLDGQPAAAVILASAPGGSGTFMDLALVLEDDAGDLVNVATAPLGDRVRVNNVTIVDNQIMVDMIAHGPDDPMCCPSQWVVAVYAFADGELVLMSDDLSVETEAVPEAEPALAGLPWMWQESHYNNDTVLAVAEPARYTVQFLPDGAVSVQADCNKVSGTYALDGNSLTITLGPSTMAACPSDSQADLFLRDLESAAGYLLESTELLITLKMDGGTMRFAGSAEVIEGVSSASRDQGDPTALSESPALSDAPQAIDIAGTEWQWAGFVDPVNGPREIPDPASYNLQFLPSGTFRMVADCNRGGGVYTTDGSSIEFSIQLLTQAECGPASLSADFIRYLEAARIFFTQDGDLFFDLFADGGTMRFSPVQ